MHLASWNVLYKKESLWLMSYYECHIHLKYSIRLVYIIPSTEPPFFSGVGEGGDLFEEGVQCLFL